MLLLECRLEWIGRVVIGMYTSLMLIVLLSLVIILMVIIILEARIRRGPDGVAPLHVAVHFEESKMLFSREMWVEELLMKKL